MINKWLYVLNNKFLDYTDKTNNFILRYPNNWESKREDDIITHEVVSFAPQLAPDSTNTKQVKIVITKEKLSESMMLSSYIESHIYGLKNTPNFTSFKIFLQKDTVFAKRTAEILVYTMIEDGKSMKCMEIFSIDGLYVYSIAYKSENDTYDRYKSEAEKIISSFEIIL